jgi:hypothetical protein
MVIRGPLFRECEQVIGPPRIMSKSSAAGAQIYGSAVRIETCYLKEIWPCTRERCSAERSFILCLILTLMDVQFCHHGTATTRKVESEMHSEQKHAQHYSTLSHDGPRPPSALYNSSNKSVRRLMGTRKIVWF